MPINRTFKMKVEMDSTNFGSYPTTALIRILRTTIQNLESGYTAKSIKDDNGNRIGEFAIEID